MEVLWFIAWLELGVPFAVAAWMQAQRQQVGRWFWAFAALLTGPVAVIVQYFALNHRALTRG